MYQVELSKEAVQHAKKLAQHEPQAYKKLVKLIQELEQHPTTGTGNPKPLGGDRAGQWSRRITDKHRLVYEVYEDVVRVLVLTAYGNYSDK